MPATISRVFMNCNSQAVRIAQQFRIDTAHFYTADGDLMIHPMPSNRGDALWSALNAFDDEDLACVVSAHSDQLPMQDTAIRDENLVDDRGAALPVSTTD